VPALKEAMSFAERRGQEISQKAIFELPMEAKKAIDNVRGCTGTRGIGD